MILEEETKEAYGYYPRELKPRSNKRVVSACELCGEFRIFPKCDYHTFCISCAHKGAMQTEETRRRQSEAQTGRKHTEDHKRRIGEAQKGRTSPMKGRKHTVESKALMCKNRADEGGEKNPNWQGGLSFEPYCIKFNAAYKQKIRERFGNVCFLCGKASWGNYRALDVHHVKYNKQCGCDDSKCICVPLCRSCHMKTNHKREYWEKLIMNKLKENISGWI